MQKTKWRNISLPDPIVIEIDEIKPDYMSISEFVRNAVRYYIDEKYLPMNQGSRFLALEEVPNIERA